MSRSVHSNETRIQIESTFYFTGLAGFQFSVKEQNRTSKPRVAHAHPPVGGPLDV